MKPKECYCIDIRLIRRTKRKIKSMSEIKNKVRSYTKLVVQEMESYAIDSGWVDSDFKVTLRMCQSKRYITSYGGLENGRPWMSLSLLEYMQPMWYSNNRKEYEYNEYDHIADDPVMGIFMSDCWMEHIAALVAHEISHAIEFYPNLNLDIPPKFNHYGGDEGFIGDYGHGREWQYMYSKLRADMVNSGKYMAMVKKFDEVEAKKVRRPSKRFKVVKFNEDGHNHIVYVHPKRNIIYGILRKPYKATFYSTFTKEGEYLGTYDKAVEARTKVLEHCQIA